MIKHNSYREQALEGDISTLGGGGGGRYHDAYWDIIIFVMSYHLCTGGVKELYIPSNTLNIPN